MANFPEFWETTGAKGWRGRCSNPRKTAQTAWDKAVKSNDWREIIAGAHGYTSYLSDCDVDPQFACMAATFINQERWEQYLDEPAAQDYLAKPKLEVVG
jgi:hypothetical protein